MGSYKLNSSAEKMREMVLSLLLLPTLAMGQCANEMPSGACCDADGFIQEADPDACSFYYDCVEGTVSHRQCEPLSADGLQRVQLPGLDRLRGATSLRRMRQQLRSWSHNHSRLRTFHGLHGQGRRVVCR